MAFISESIHARLHCIILENTSLNRLGHASTAMNDGVLTDKNEKDSVVNCSEKQFQNPNVKIPNEGEKMPNKGKKKVWGDLSDGFTFGSCS